MKRPPPNIPRVSLALNPRYLFNSCPRLLHNDFSMFHPD